jgi:hypothetical protein
MMRISRSTVVIAWGAFLIFWLCAYQVVHAVRITDESREAAVRTQSNVTAQASPGNEHGSIRKGTAQDGRSESTELNNQNISAGASDKAQPATSNTSPGFFQLLFNGIWDIITSIFEFIWNVIVTIFTIVFVIIVIIAILSGDSSQGSSKSYSSSTSSSHKMPSGSYIDSGIYHRDRTVWGGHADILYHERKAGNVTRVIDKHAKFLGYCRDGMTFDKNCKLVARSEEPGLLFKGYDEKNK